MKSSLSEILGALSAQGPQESWKTQPLESSLCSRIMSQYISRDKVSTRCGDLKSNKYTDLRDLEEGPSNSDYHRCSNC